jgi:hypothetical protein
MKNKTIKLAILITSLITLIFNVSPLLAQTLEIEVVGGGFKIRGPENINFSPVQTSFSDQTSEMALRDIEVVDTDTQNLVPGGIVIIDESGGSTFSVYAGASDLYITGESCIGTALPYYNCIYTDHIFIKNHDGNGSQVDTIYGDSTDLTLDSSTDSYVDFTTTRTLANGISHVPGTWKIYPKLRINIPKGQNAGTYNGNLNFTIS